MTRVLTLLLLVSFSIVSTADIIPCIKWVPVTSADIDEVLKSSSDEEKSKVHGITGRKSELTSKKCWNSYDMNGEHSVFGTAKVFVQPKELGVGLCKSRSIDMTFSDGVWSSERNQENYSIILAPMGGCVSSKVEEFISLTNQVEDTASLALLKKHQLIYEQYLELEKNAISGLKFTSIGLTTTDDLNTYYSLGFSNSCSTLYLYVKINERGEPMYVTHDVLMC